jgi:serine/threonine protein kinase
MSEQESDEIVSKTTNLDSTIRLHPPKSHPERVNAATDLPKSLASPSTRNRERYDVTREHARGGMGRILDAYDVELGRRVALKELLRRTPELEARFAREALITARLQHPGIVPIHDAGRDETGAPFYVMKLLTGESLKIKLSRCSGLVERLELLPNLLAAAEAVAFAHANRVIHRDLKPSNIMIGEYGETVVIDWGLAKELSSPDPGDPTSADRSDSPSDANVTAAGALLGTIDYMAPEQAHCEAADERSDVYALGTILNEMLSGKCRDEIPPDDHAPRDLIGIASKATAPRPEDRYPTANEFASHLNRFLKNRIVYSASTNAARNHNRVYGKPTLYELAFSYRDISAECRFLKDAFHQITGSSPTSFLDVAAGPACHSRWFAAQGARCSAIDSAEEMVRYGRERIHELGFDLDYCCADMVDFRTKGKHDLAACMLNSLTYLHTNESVIAHLQAVARALRPGGLYVIELGHPVELFRRGSVTHKTWKIQDNRGVLSVAWEYVEATFDPTTQCQQVDVLMRYCTDSGEVIEQLSDSSLERMFTFNELDAIVRASGVFRLVRVFGALNINQEFSCDSWRMVPVLEAV